VLRSKVNKGDTIEHEFKGLRLWMRFLMIGADTPERIDTPESIAIVGDDPWYCSVLPPVGKGLARFLSIILDRGCCRLED